MKKVIVSLIIIFISSNCYSQFVYKLKADSVKITNDSCNAELIIENSSKNVSGFLFNNGNGRTIFKSGLSTINSKKYLIGSDTLDLSNIGTVNLQAVTTVGNKTSNSIWTKALIMGDTTLAITATGSSSIAGGVTSTTGVVRSEGIGAIAMGSGDSGTIKASGGQSLAMGAVSTANGVVLASGTGATAMGQASYVQAYRGTPSVIQATGAGAQAHGITYGATIEATQVGANAWGMSQNTGVIRSNSYGSTAGGMVQGNGNGESIIASNYGSFAYGHVTANSSSLFGGQLSTIQSTGRGAIAVGEAMIRGQLLAMSFGSQAFGLAQTKGTIQATSTGSFASGFASDSTTDGTQSSYIKSTAFGSFAQGYAGFPLANSHNVGFILADSRGSFASGWSSSGLSYIRASGQGSTARGYAANGGLIGAMGDGSLAVGTAQSATDSVYAGGQASVALGRNVVAAGQLSHVHGYNVRNSKDRTFTVGFNKQQFIIDGDVDQIQFNSATLIYTTAAPPTPAPGSVVEWFDGVNKWYKKSDGMPHQIY
ncbi:MAG: hypothetical protein JWQ09_2324 [Segetibacter sp.]|nr:hypothetical protein [Segetibacter sp.]